MEVDPRREPISNAGNLKKGSCHKSYKLWKNCLNGLSFDSQSSESESIKRERKCGLLMYASIPTVFFLSLWLSFQSFFLFSGYSMYFFVYYSLFSTTSVAPLLFMTTPFYTICHCGIYPFCPSTVFGSL